MLPTFGHHASVVPTFLRFVLDTSVSAGCCLAVFLVVDRADASMRAAATMLLTCDEYAAVLVVAVGCRSCWSKKTNVVHELPRVQITQNDFDVYSLWKA
jgi:hypothetical protein